jgi:hypothetical protein
MTSAPLFIQPSIRWSTRRWLIVSTLGAACSIYLVCLSELMCVYAAHSSQSRDLNSEQQEPWQWLGHLLCAQAFNQEISTASSKSIVSG